MTSRDIFALVVRVAGLVSLLYFISLFIMMFFAAGLHWSLALRGVAWFLLTLWLLRGAPQLVRFAYPDGR